MVPCARPGDRVTIIAPDSPLTPLGLSPTQDLLPFQPEQSLALWFWLVLARPRSVVLARPRVPGISHYYRFHVLVGCTHN